MDVNCSCRRRWKIYGWIAKTQMAMDVLDINHEHVLWGLKVESKCCQRKFLISFFMVEEDNERLIIVRESPNSNNTVEVKWSEWIERGKVHLNLQAEEAQVLLDTNWIIYWNGVCWNEVRRIIETFDYKGKIEIFEPQREPERTKNLPYLIVIKIQCRFLLALQLPFTQLFSGCWDLPSVHNHSCSFFTCKETNAKIFLVWPFALLLTHQPCVRFGTVCPFEWFSHLIHKFSKIFDDNMQLTTFNSFHTGFIQFCSVCPCRFVSAIHSINFWLVSLWLRKINDEIDQ